MDPQIFENKIYSIPFLKYDLLVAERYMSVNVSAIPFHTSNTMITVGTMSFKIINSILSEVCNVSINFCTKQ